MRILGSQESIGDALVLDFKGLLIFLILTGCCPNGNPFEWSLKRFLPRNLGEVEDKRCQLFEP